MENVPPPLRSSLQSSVARRRLSVFLKIGGILLLIVLLHIPLLLTRGVLHERLGYQRQATEEIASIWGRQQILVGPVLAVPYAWKSPVIRTRLVGGRKVDVEEVEYVSATAYFLPETLEVTGKVSPEVRHRGIYDAVVYTAQTQFKGAWNPDFVAADISADRIDWEKAHVLFGVSDLRGVRTVGPVQLNGAERFPFEAAEAGSLLALDARVSGVTAGARVEFLLEAVLQGSDLLQMAPVGKTTTVTLESPWADPSFMGAYLPVAREVTNGGFKATWETAHFSRGFPGSWTDRTTEGGEWLSTVNRAAFGVRFAQLTDNYSMTERAQKYGVLFFVLIFAVFFLFEMSAGLRIHPLQYGVVGAALCLFFLGFLALSEFWPTGRAYAAAAAACTVMVAAYAWSFLKTGWRALAIGGGLGGTYGYLYFVLKSQDYALIAGTAALFVALGALMYVTRRIDWFAHEATRGPRAQEANP